jgi:outer membrane protein assembly factor BamE (lipoprotein component of BamABCDE complex)
MFFPFSSPAIPEIRKRFSRERNCVPQPTKALPPKGRKAIGAVLAPLGLLGLCLGLWGCTDLSTGRDFDTSKVRQIVRRKTTEKQILAMFGTPLRKYPVQSSGEGWTYTFQTAAATTPGHRKNLTILFNMNKVVLNYSLRQGLVPAQRTPSVAQRAPMDGSTVYATRAPIAKATPPVKFAPIAKVKPPVKVAPIAKATPIAKAKPPVKVAPIAKATPPARVAPVAKATPPAKAAPIAKNTPPPANESKPKIDVTGPVMTTVTNESATPLTLKVERNGNTVAQVKLIGQGSKNVLLPRGDYGMKLKLNGQCYRAPGFTVASKAASLKLIWKDANMANLHPISEAEFQQ